MDNELDDLSLVIPFNESIFDLIDRSKISQYIFNYLSDLDAKTIVIENNYVDRDYLIDFAKYYSRSFNVHDKFTCRYHFFSNEFDEENFKSYLNSGKKEDFELLNSHYLGYTVVKPIKDKYGIKLIGKTLLKTYDVKDGDFYRVYLKQKYNVSLFGISLTIESLPFQTQDSTVGGCATIACWTSVYPLSELFGIEQHSPYEVTEKSISYPSESRNFPSKGLTLIQIKNYYNTIGMDTEIINPYSFHKSKDYTSSDDVVADVIKAYISLGLPIIAAISLKKDILGSRGEKSRSILFRRRLLRKKIPPHYDYHAVVISGYKHNNGKIIEIYLHDDNIGPYCRTYPVSDFCELDNEWLKYGYSDINIKYLLVPVYPKIRLSFLDVYPAYLNLKRFFEGMNKKFFNGANLDDSLGVVPELYLTDVKKMKHKLLTKDIGNKIEILQKPFPRFLWNINTNIRGIDLFDTIYDATDVHAYSYLENIEHNLFNENVEKDLI